MGVIGRVEVEGVIVAVRRHSGNGGWRAVLEGLVGTWNEKRKGNYGPYLSNLREGHRPKLEVTFAAIHAQVDQS